MIKDCYKVYLQETVYLYWYSKGRYKYIYSELKEPRVRYISKYSYYRYPKTFNEIRLNEGAVVDGFKVRGKRRKTMLPTCWDDQYVSNNCKRSWKDFTKNKKQWMKK